MTQSELGYQRDVAIRMLAEWCVAVQYNGTGWDDWDEHYKEASYRDNPIRNLLDLEIQKVKDDWGVTGN